MSAPTTETTAAFEAAAAEAEEALLEITLLTEERGPSGLDLTAAVNEARLRALDALAELQSRAGALARELAAWNPRRVEVDR